MTVVSFPSKEYTAKSFEVTTIFGNFKISGTLCGAVDFATPQSGTYTFTVEELDCLIDALSKSRKDVVENSKPFDDPRLID